MLVFIDFNLLVPLVKSIMYYKLLLIFAILKLRIDKNRIVLFKTHLFTE